MHGVNLNWLSGLNLLFLLQESKILVNFAREHAAIRNFLDTKGRMQVIAKKKNPK